jgi:uncharacterized protein YxjI
MFKHKTPTPTDEDLNFVHPSPKQLLHPGVPADKFYHLIMKEKLWRSWSGDTFGIKYSQPDGDEANPFEVDIKGVALSLRDRMVVRDSQTNTPVAVIIGLFFKWENTYKIYTFTPNAEHQAPSTNQKHDGKNLYEWATCKDKAFSVNKTMETVDGVKYKMEGVGKVFAAKRQMRITRNGKVCMYAKEKTLMFGFTGNQWEIKIGPGIDPALMVAFMAVMDEMNEDKNS